MRYVGTLFGTMAAAAAAVVISATAPALADGYPERPITLIVPWNAGGTTDIVARLFAPELSEELGQPVAVVNKVGGGGALGTKEALDAKDGYTIIMTTSGNHILTPLAKDVGYRADEFAGIGQLSERTLILAVQDDAAWSDLKELQADAKANPGKYTFGAVPNVLPFLTLKSWADKAGVELVHVPQQGGAPGVNGVLGGHLDMVPESLASVQSHLKAGTMKGLAVFNKERDPNAPDVPTAKEQGFEVYGNPFTGVAVAKDVPPEVVEKLRAATAKIAKDPDFVKKMQQSGDGVQYLDGPAFEEVWMRDWNNYEPILKK
ncbi:tripartite tricarboxylate transporter substrate binding protein [Marinibaculum pumilum]|uniref:Tripartite tricarboxylate transporter substrate binding protein n=1 Tax=Marinibaculum pumilum TaxID=1766165 RepID=A0ABV7KZV6_9PROT